MPSRLHSAPKSPELEGRNENFSIWGTHVQDKEDSPFYALAHLSFTALVWDGECYFQDGKVRLPVHLTGLGSCQKGSWEFYPRSS